MSTVTVPSSMTAYVKSNEISAEPEYEKAAGGTFNPVCVTLALPVPLRSKARMPRLTTGLDELGSIATRLG
ncbi:MAG: hypothetical protein IPP91_09820 [Betaproteobacteria bacterium]|nr:hypothetical protein [Betaproteobacteria bacterium]